MSAQKNAEWVALRDAVNTLLYRAATAQGYINQHEFLPADDDAQRIEGALRELDSLARNAVMRCARWRAVQS